MLKNLTMHSFLFFLFGSIMIDKVQAADQIGAKIDVQGHRGARAVLPENSLAAFEYAIELGVDTLEFDMGVTQDGVVVVIHDQKINPVICQYKNGDPIEEELWVHQLSYEQIKQFDCGSKQNPRFKKQKTITGTEIPALEEVFEMVKNSTLENAKTVLFNIETKSDPSLPFAQPEPDVFVELVYETVKKFGLENRVTLQSFDHRTLVSAAQYAPELQRSALFSEAPEDWLQAAIDADAHVISPHHQIINRKTVELLQEEGLAVIPWTANSKRQWARLIKLGVDGIISDDPKALIDFLSR